MTEIEKLYFNIFKLQLVAFVEKQFSVCDNFKIKLSNCKDEIEIKILFREYRDDVFTKLGGNLNKNEDEVEDLERDVRDLENEISELEDTLDNLGYYSRSSSLNDEYKIKYFMEYKDKYSPWELEEILKNGKDNKITILEEEIKYLNYEISELQNKIYDLE
jgi:polyhydroxyalkanoate synthesis regulator phasin